MCVKKKSRPSDPFNNKKTHKVEQVSFFIYVLRGSRFTTILPSAFPGVDEIFALMEYLCVDGTFGIFREFSYFPDQSQFAFTFVAQI